MAITVPKPQQAHSNCPSGCKEHRRGKYLTIFDFFFIFIYQATWKMTQSGFEQLRIIMRIHRRIKIRII